ncbi:hypothetical protein SAMN05518855_101117 [Paenibacillus sp. CF384]|nr:hypothetical protein SAMN05518855_101117 [Paenibacillus sp. CF384]
MVLYVLFYVRYIDTSAPATYTKAKIFTTAQWRALLNPAMEPILSSIATKGRLFMFSEAAGAAAQ